MSYSPTMMRWMEADPIGYVDGPDKYELEHGNPINHVDPTGLLTGDEDDQHGSLAGPPWGGPHVYLPYFAGFLDPRYQQYDDLIITIVDAFNKNKQGFAGGTAEQCKNIPDLSGALIKSWIIQETGGGDARSKAAWAVDPAQVNVPGDWNDYKADLNLQQSTLRNTGDLRTNLIAAVEYLVRKGFGISGQPAGKRPTGTFDSWRIALIRYNGRTRPQDLAVNGKFWAENYADRIIERANDPAHYYPIELPKLAK